jgi:hypothetical protein
VRRTQPLSNPDNVQQLGSLDSSPSAIKFTASSMLPSSEKIANATIEELRTMVEELVIALTDARMSAAHYKLQHTLLLMETNEAAQRAEVEHQMARREVEVLHASEQRHRIAASAAPQQARASPQPQIVALTKTCKHLEDERDDAEEQLQETKKYLEFEKDRSELLTEENLLLKRRIRENREHFTKLKDQSPMYATPRQAPYTTPRRKSYSRFAESTPAHDNFAALLYADQMLSQETTSVPSTPTKNHASRVKHGHTRGAHSLSSLQTTPAHRPVTSDSFAGPLIPASAPGSQLVNESSARRRHDRDSTISMSDAEDQVSGEDIGQSQASSLATDMLRKNPASQETIRQSQEVERSSSLLQTKLFGSVKKPGSSKLHNKRNREVSDNFSHNKKSKLNEGVGLGVGIDDWRRTSS